MKVQSLIYYPVKACKGVEVQSSLIDPRGLEDDRRLSVVDISGKSLSQRDVPALALVEPMLVDRDTLILNAPGMEPLAIDLTFDRLNCDVKIWDQSYVAVDQGYEAAEWFSHYLKAPSRLARIGDAFDRKVNVKDEYVAHASFADHFPVVIGTQEALDYLNQSISVPVNMSRYRPNIVLSGTEAFEEYEWSEIQIGPVKFAMVRVCDRCSVTTIDQETGAQSKESMVALANFAQGKKEKKPVFGIHATPLTLGKISLSDEVSVVRTQSQTCAG